MATVPETQAYLTEAKTPTVIGFGGFTTATKQYLSFVGRMVQQAQKELALLEEAHMVEPDVDLAKTFEATKMKLKAMIREGAALQKALAEMHKAGREWKVEDASMRAAAAPLGYTV